MAEIEIINIMWEGPLTLKKAYNRKKKSDKGLYQVYGYHPVYGLDELVYIGKTQKLGERPAEHGFEGWNQVIQVYLGRIISITEEETKSSDTNNKAHDRKLDQVEGLLIHACWPAYNSQHIKSPPRGCNNLLILNWGKFRKLPEAISGYRTSKGSLDKGSYRFMWQ